MKAEDIWCAIGWNPEQARALTAALSKPPKLPTSPAPSGSPRESETSNDE